MENVEDKQLNDFLREAELQHYNVLFREVLRVARLTQLKSVGTEELTNIGLSKPEQRRFTKLLSKYFPKTYLSRLKWWIRSKKKRPYCNGQSAHNDMELQSFSDTDVNLSPKYLISLRDLKINKLLGSGQFGVVRQGTWNTGNQVLQVAIKCLGSERMVSSSTEFLKEAGVMHSIEHPNIVRLFGVVLEYSPFMLVTELAPLRSLLDCLHDVSLRADFPIPNLCGFAEQICNGMTYLENKRLIHRDLAARNILVFSKDRVKISDFGLSRALGVGKDYYRTNYNVNLKLPVAWCAPECILYLRFTSFSDMWAYGVCLWEMFTYGFQPWAGLSGQDILKAIDAPNFQRLERPECCPEAYYNMMLKCWSHEPTDRPRFKELGPSLRAIRPEEVQAVANYQKLEDGRRSCFLEYKTDQIITVLGKEETTKCAMWYGALPGGACGMFDPNHTKPYNRHDQQIEPRYKPAKDIEQVPLITPNYQSNRASSSGTSPYFLGNYDPDSRADGDEVDMPGATTKRSRRFNHKATSEPTTSKRILTKARKSTLSRSQKAHAGQAVPSHSDVHEYQEISEPDVTDNTDFSKGLLDEMEMMFRNMDSDSSEAGPSISEGACSRAHTLSKGDKKKISDTGTMKPMSAYDEKTLDTAVAMANEITTKSMTDLESDSKLPKSPSDKSKLHLKFPQLSLHHNPLHDLDRDAAAKLERRQFCEETKRHVDIQASITEDSKAAYMCLIDEPTPATSLVTHFGTEPCVRNKTGTTHKPSRNSAERRSQFHSLPKQPTNKSRSRTLSAGDTDRRGKKNVVNEVPLPSRANKPKLVDQRRHIRKYPLRLPTEQTAPQAGPSGHNVYQNASLALPSQLQTEQNHQNDVDVTQGAIRNDNSVYRHGSSSAATFNPYIEPLPGVFVDDDTEESDGDNDEIVQYVFQDNLVKDRTDHVSVEDLLEFADQKPCGRQRGVESDEVRVMQKVLKQEVTPQECLEALEMSEWNVHYAIKLMRVKILAEGETLEDCCVELKKVKGDINKAVAILAIKKRNQ